MADILRMPKMSDTMEEGVIASWLKKVGDTVKAGDVLAEVETDKATMELESYQDGTLLYIGAKVKEAVKIDGVIAIIGKKGENIDALLASVQDGGGVKAVAEAAPLAKAEPVVSSAPQVDTSKIKASVITMPKMSDTMSEGTIAAWHKKVGDKIKSGDILAEVETDKATMELEAYEDGTLLYIGIDAGNAAKVDEIIAVVGEKGADFQALINAKKSGGSAPIALAPEAKKAEVASPAAAASTSHASSDDRLKVSPLAKKLAEEKGIDLKLVKGSAENGRIVKRDVESFKGAPSAAPAAKSATPSVTLPSVVGQESYEEVAVSQMRKTIAKRLAESKFSAPHFYLTMEITMDKAIAARNSMNEVSPVKISFNDMVIKAVAASLRQHPKVNASWLGDKIRYNHHIHIGVAVAVEEGLLVPVVRFADSKSLSHISTEVKDLGAKAKNKQLQPKDWEGNTFTISNLGMFGIDQFTAIINPPDACILAVGGIKETVGVKNGQFFATNIMKVTMSCDHRVVDGAVGSAFLKTLKDFLEDPVRILI